MIHNSARGRLDLRPIHLRSVAITVGARWREGAFQHRGPYCRFSARREDPVSPLCAEVGGSSYGRISPWPDTLARILLELGATVDLDRLDRELHVGGRADVGGGTVIRRSSASDAARIRQRPGGSRLGYLGIRDARLSVLITGKHQKPASGFSFWIESGNPSFEEPTRLI
jgi:hypothetical protein